MRLLPLLLLVAAAPAWATIEPITNPFPAIQPLPFRAALVPFVNVPAEQAVAPTARPQYVTPANDGTGRLFINDLRGVLYVTNQAGATPTPYIDLRTQGIGVSTPASPSTDGFSGIAFHPNFNGDPTKPGYGVFYTRTLVDDNVAPTIGAQNGPISTRITEFTTTDPTAATFTGTSRLVATLGSGTGSIAFNPTATPGSADYGKLYIASGETFDNDAGQQAQNLASAQGKILRIDPARGPGGEPYTIPADNPYAGQPGTLPEIWASGLRNPQSFTWDKATGAMYINDLGQAGIEEVNLGKAGANYGWSLREGIFATVYAFGYNPDNESIYPWPAGRDTSAYTDPIACYSHQEGYALGSGFLYRGSAIPQLTGQYVMADIVLGRIFAFDPTTASGGCGATLSELLLTLDGEPENLAQDIGYNTFINGPRVDARLSMDNNGEILLALKANGEVYQLTADPIPEPSTWFLLATALPLLTRRRRAWLTAR